MIDVPQIIKANAEFGIALTEAIVRIDGLKNFILASKRNHDFQCYMRDATGQLERRCTCGADEYNASCDALVRDIAEDQQKGFEHGTNKRS